MFVSFPYLFVLLGCASHFLRIDCILQWPKEIINIMFGSLIAFSMGYLYFQSTNCINSLINVSKPSMCCRGCLARAFFHQKEAPLSHFLKVLKPQTTTTKTPNEPRTLKNIQPTSQPASQPASSQPNQML